MGPLRVIPGRFAPASSAPPPIRVFDQPRRRSVRQTWTLLPAETWRDCAGGQPMLSAFCGTETELCRYCARHRRAFGGAERRAALCCYLWHRWRRGAYATAVDRCGSWHRQDQDTGASGGATDFRRCRPAPSAAVDVYPPRGARDDPPRAADPRCEPTRSSVRRRRSRAVALVGHISFDRQPAVAPTCHCSLAGSRLHRARPRRQHGPDGLDSQRSRPRANPLAVSKKGDVLGDLFLHGQCRLPA